MSQLATYYQRDYSGGLNNTASPREIDPDQATVLENWDITYQGQLRRRPGLILTGNVIGANPIKGLGAFLQSGGGRNLLLMEGTNLRYLNGSTWDLLDSGFVVGNPFWFETVSASDKVFFSNEDNTIHWWDRASVVLNACLTDLGGAVPHGNVLRWHKNHLFTLNNVDLGGTDYRHDLFWSNMNDPLTWDTINNHFSIPGKGRAITAVDLGDRLMLFKERSIQYLDGWGSSSWQITASSSNVANLDESVGCVAPRGATRVGNECWFIDADANIRRIYQTDFDAFRHDVISKNIQGTLATINKTALDKTVSWTNANKVFFAIPTGTSTTPNLVCVFDLIVGGRTNREAWTTYTGWNVGLFTSFPTSTTPDLYVGDATTGQVFRHAGTSDNGVAIAARWDGGQNDFKQPERYKRYKFGYISGSAESSMRVNVHSSVDGGPFAKLNDLVLDVTGSRLGPTGSFLLGPTGDARLSGRTESQSKFYFSSGGGAVGGRKVQLSIRHSGLNEQPTVNGPTIHFRQRQLR